MKYGYARVSTDDQNADMQLKALISHAQALLNHGEQAESVASSLKVARATLYRALQRAA